MRVVRFLDLIKKDASEIYLLGDVLDYWYEYRYVVPRGYVRFFGKLAELTDAGIKVSWIIGNHDIWIFNYIPDELGVEVVDGVLDREVLGTTRMVMAHGDGVWIDSRKFRIIRSLFRNRFCQRLFAGIHPRWTVPFAYAWSNHSRESGNVSEVGNRGEEQSGRMERNIEGYRSFCKSYLLKAPDCRYFLFGHLHRLIREKIGSHS